MKREEGGGDAMHTTISAFTLVQTHTHTHSMYAHTEGSSSSCPKSTIAARLPHSIDKSALMTTFAMGYNSSICLLVIM